MKLCNLCDGFDVRALLLSSLAQRSEATGNTNRNFVDAEDLRPAIPHFYPHYKTIVGLKNSAEEGCRLCELFWKSWLATLPKTDFTEEWLECTFEGQVYIGCSMWSTSRQGVPYVTISQKTLDGRNRTLCSFEAFVERDDVPEDGRDLLGRAVYSDPSSEACIVVAKDWLSECLNGHKQCAALATSKKSLPTRVIEVGDETSHPKLITTGGTTGTWVALSYCWGGDSTFVLNETKRPDLQQGIPVQDFPPTLRDAVLVTRRLGLQYLWIDALCIQQDSKEDWAREAAKMREVYSGAVLTITAANSPSTISGIFFQREAKSPKVPIKWKIPDDSQKRRDLERTSEVYLRPGSELWDHKLQASRLMTRGWTLQEGLLAPRTLSFGEQQMIWECPQHQADEGGRITQATEDYRVKGFIQGLIQIEREPAPKPRQNLLGRLTQLSLRSNKQDPWWKTYGIANPYDKWYDIVQQFTGRSLTVDTDVLPALAGIARAFQPLLNDTYCAGLWEKDILCSLIWARSPRYPTDGSSRFDPTRRSGYIAPSWSWASLVGKEASMISNWKNRDSLQSAISIAKIVSVSTQLAGSDPFGQVTRGELVLRARFYRIENLPPAYSLSQEWPASADEFPKPKSRENYKFQKLIYTNMLLVDRMVYEFFQQHEPYPGQHFGVVEIVRWELSPDALAPGSDFLIVESTGEKEDEYRRVSSIAIRKEPIPNKEDVSAEQYAGAVLETEAYKEVIAANWKKRTITII
ncbi:hypothetical protein G7Y89_g10167 [Cudoniella acicularis]|uniref:Heterokaryon incompatibility domain-containing protein n=1 Tax=Cudoniella acicularis TaxID=354080 RepID=A0A8H4RFL1_9HELO|nr:hypothetical protein G7Y89_g10167 [Cudoniella acicularis]